MNKPARFKCAGLFYLFDFYDFRHKFHLLFHKINRSHEFQGGLNMNPNQNTNEYKAAPDIPYPPIKAEHICKESAYTLLGNVGSRNSEMSAVSQYFFSSILLAPNHPNIARYFRAMSMSEMHHLSVFSSLVYQMGISPRLWSINQQKHCISYWTPAYNHYTSDLHEIIKTAVRDEEYSIQKYTRQSETINDPGITKILSRIILDEKHHIKILEMIQNML